MVLVYVWNTDKITRPLSSELTRRVRKKLLLRPAEPLRRADRGALHPGVAGNGWRPGDLGDSVRAGRGSLGDGSGTSGDRESGGGIRNTLGCLSLV